MGRDPRTARREEAQAAAGLADASSEGWTVHCAFFARVGFTGAARSLAQDHTVLLVGLERLDRDLRVVGGVR